MLSHKSVTREMESFDYIVSVTVHLQESAKSLLSLFDPLTLALSILILFLKN